MKNWLGVTLKLLGVVSIIIIIRFLFIVVHGIVWEYIVLLCIVLYHIVVH